MNPEFEKAGAELVQWMTDAAKSGGDFVAEQAPQLAQEIVAWHFWSNVFTAALVSVVLLPIALAAGGICYRETKRTYPHGDGSGAVLSGIVSLIAISIVTLTVGFNGYEAVKAAVAPRLIVIEYAGKVLNGK